MRSFSIIIMVLMFSGPIYGYGAESVNLPTINPGKDTMVRLPGTPKKFAKVRIGLQMIPYKKLIVTDQAGANKLSYAKDNPIRRNLRARIDKTTHFYVKDWHISLDPVSWDKTHKTLAYKVNLYRIYGQEYKLEEFIGSMELNGVIEGENFLYEFIGKNSIKFTNKSAVPLVELYLQEPIKAPRKMNVATFKPTEPSKKNNSTQQ